MFISYFFLSFSIPVNSMSSQKSASIEGLSPIIISPFRSINLHLFGLSVECIYPVYSTRYSLLTLKEICGIIRDKDRPSKKLHKTKYSGRIERGDIFQEDLL